MKWILSFFLSTIFFWGNAAHIIGGEITYHCIEEGRYEFTMILYRDCNGNGTQFDSDTGAPFSATITIYKGTEQFRLLDLDAPIVENISDLNQIPGIQPPSNSCVERGIYIFEVDLPEDEDYNIAYQRCCYNNSINNINSPELLGITVATQISGDYACNDSPIFSNVPQYFLKGQSPFTIDLSAVDSDGDSLAYELCSPLTGGGPNTTNFDASFGIAPNPDTNLPYDTIVFTATLNNQQPFLSDPPLSLDSKTGILTGNSILLGNFLLAACIKEFRDGNLIGITRRQFQINVSNEVVNTKNEFLEASINLFPNPSEEYVRINFPNDLVINFYRIIDVRGEVIIQQKFRNIPLQIEDLSKGLYFIEMNTSKGRIVKKLLRN